MHLLLAPRIILAHLAPHAPGAIPMSHRPPSPPYSAVASPTPPTSRDVLPYSAAWLLFVAHRRSILRHACFSPPCPRERDYPRDSIAGRSLIHPLAPRANFLCRIPRRGCCYAAISPQRSLLSGHSWLGIHAPSVPRPFMARIANRCGILWHACWSLHDTTRPLPAHPARSPMVLLPGACPRTVRHNRAGSAIATEGRAIE